MTTRRATTGPTGVLVGDPGRRLLVETCVEERRTEGVLGVGLASTDWKGFLLLVRVAVS
jgi:hypothetical protein